MLMEKLASNTFHFQFSTAWHKFPILTQKSKIELLCRSPLVSLDPYKVFLESYEILSKSMFFAPALLSECILCSCEGQRCSRWWWSVPVQTLCCKFSPPLLLLITETSFNTQGSHCNKFWFDPFEHHFMHNNCDGWRRIFCHCRESVQVWWPSRLCGPKYTHGNLDHFQQPIPDTESFFVSVKIQDEMSWFEIYFNESKLTKYM